MKPANLLRRNLFIKIYDSIQADFSLVICQLLYLIEFEHQIEFAICPWWTWDEPLGFYVLRIRITVDTVEVILKLARVSEVFFQW